MRTMLLVVVFGLSVSGPSIAGHPMAFTAK